MNRDLVLMVTAFGGIALGVLFPGPAGIFTPFTLYLMMTILFMSFLGINFAALARLDRARMQELGLWTVIKLAALPLGLWAVAKLTVPEWALPVLLLSGVPAGVTGPFFAQMLGADTAGALKIVVVTSVLAPFTLPGLVWLLEGANLNIPLFNMVRLLALVIFLPLILAWAVQRFFPGFPARLAKVQFHISVTFFFLINLGVFAPYAEFVRSQGALVLTAVLLSYALAAVFAGLPLGLGRAAGGRLDGLTGAVCLGFVNNVLALVFTARFFGPKSPLLAAAYMLPYFTLVIPLRLAARRRAAAGQGAASRP
ncbi:MAG: bile acid:sodium symporter [Deltaproteobacteria bacterium]|nr:bile acid:sodium symporter [Deltaproteobacteria bacterium]